MKQRESDGGQMAAAAGQAVSADTEKEHAGGEAAERVESGKAEAAGFEEARWRPVLALPCQISVDLPMAHFTVADFLHLKPGSVIATDWRLARDVPLRANGTLIAWVEFEGSGGRLGVRITEIA
jgi:flagellar motor switch/type III secretory pathway protein FliN